MGQAQPDIRIHYLSADQVFLDQGRNKGLAVGDILEVRSAGKLLATLEITALTQNSAACTILRASEELSIGDPVFLKTKATETLHKETAETEPSQRIRTRNPATREQPAPIKQKKKFKGTVSLQYYQFSDRETPVNDFSQPGLRLNLRGNQLFNGNFSMRIKTRLRYTENNRPPGADRRGDDLRNRIYEASLTYGKEDARFTYRLGRIISNKFSGVGYIDGGLLETRIQKNLHLGVFAGTQPEWQHSDLRTRLQKTGLYAHFQRGTYQTKLFESTVALAGEYHGGTVNREFLYFRNRYVAGRLFQLFQSAEVEINRDWREQKAGNSLALTNLHLNGRFQIHPKANFTISYDDRQNYYTYELRNQDEQFFDSLSRKGLRGRFQIRFSRYFNGSFHYGMRKRETDVNDSNYYGVNLYRRRLIDGTWSLNFKWNGFENPISEGSSPSLKIGKSFANQKHTLYLAYSQYDYRYLFNQTTRDSQWFRGEGYFTIGRQFFLSGQLEYNSGDDIEGYRLFFNFGYRL